MNTGIEERDPTPPPPAARELESQLLKPSQAQALVRLLEAAPEVQRRHQFFVWSLTHVQALLPHVLAVCGAYSRRRRAVVYEPFHSVALPQPLLDTLVGPEPQAMAELARLWVEGLGRPYLLNVTDPAVQARLRVAAELAGAGLQQLAVHGVARPGRLHEIESLFMLVATVDAAPPANQVVALMDLTISALHATYTRVQTLERELGLSPGQSSAPSKQAPPITARERQILSGVREGKNNQEIGVQLGISALTVKNHVQKILRKLGAANRAQAVAKAMTMKLLHASDAPE
jgi:transcriptional regulator EpsA